MNRFGNITIVFFLIVALVMPVFAHTDPAGCTATGSGVFLTVYRADGVTPVDNTVESGETIVYAATIVHPGVPSVCNFEGGALTITTPDGVDHVVASGVGIPLISSGNSFTGPQQSYVVSEVDVNDGDLFASVAYTNGVVHRNGHQSTSASTTINNEYEDVALTVNKTVDTSFTRTFEWIIEKTVSEDLELFDGQSDFADWNVTVTKSDPIDSGHTVSGVITIHNPAQFAIATITAVDDVLSIDGAAITSCPGGIPQDLGPGETLECTYNEGVADGTTQTNTVTVTTSGDVDGGSDDADVVFGEPVEVFYDEVTVSDDNEGALGTTNISTSFLYSNEYDCDAVEYVDGVGSYQVPNTAIIEETEQSDNATLTVTCKREQSGAGFLIIDEDSIDNDITFWEGGRPLTQNSGEEFTTADVNEDVPGLGQRAELRFFTLNPGAIIVLQTGEVGDEAWFAPETIPESWNNAGPTVDGLRNFLGDTGFSPTDPTPHGVGNGLGGGNDPEKLLDKIPDVTPLRATGLSGLIGGTYCAVVYDSDVSINYDPIDGSLKGETLGTVAFEVLDVHPLYGFSSGTLPAVEIQIRSTLEVCGGTLNLFDAPDLESSSEPYDTGQ